MALELTPDETELILSTRAATAAYHADQDRLYATMRRQCLADGMVEVEPGHFVKPGEPWTGEDGTFHLNALTPSPASK